jgi:hypothetical protein
MSDWLHSLPVLWMAILVFGFTYLITAGIYAVITVFAVGERARSFKAISPGLLPPLGKSRRFLAPLASRSISALAFSLSVQTWAAANTTKRPKMISARRDEYHNCGKILMEAGKI